MARFTIKNSYTPQELMKGASISRHLYNQWLFKEVIQRQVDAQGPGTVSEYSLENIIGVVIVKGLKDIGVRLKVAIEVSKWVQKKYSEELKQPIEGPLKVDTANMKFSPFEFFSIRFDLGRIQRMVLAKIE